MATTINLIDDELIHSIKEDTNEWAKHKGRNTIIKCYCVGSNPKFNVDSQSAICNKCGYLRIQFNLRSDKIVVLAIECHKCEVFFWPTTSYRDNFSVGISYDKFLSYDNIIKHDKIILHGCSSNPIVLNSEKINDIESFLYYFKLSKRKGDWIIDNYFESIPKKTLQKLINSVNPNKNNQTEEIVIDI